MHRAPLLYLALALAATSLSSAHAPVGTPKTYCEPFSEWGTHDVLPPVNGIAGAPSRDGNPEDCDGNGTLRDFDGHAEHAVSAALILVDSGQGLPSPHGDVGAGTLHCFGAEGHHMPYGPFDGEYSTEHFHVGVDTLDLTGLGQGCGDHLLDQSEMHLGCPCTVTYPPGLDGAYHLVVEDPHPGTHVFWS